jgi:hypothetical protein
MFPQGLVALNGLLADKVSTGFPARIENNQDGTPDHVLPDKSANKMRATSVQFLEGSGLENIRQDVIKRQLIGLKIESHGGTSIELISSNFQAYSPEMNCDLSMLISLLIECVWLQLEYLSGLKVNK